MTDIELIFELAKRLGLNGISMGEPGNKEFSVVPTLMNNEVAVRFGNGCGYNDFHVEFYFDESGKLVNHGVWE